MRPPLLLCDPLDDNFFSDLKIWMRRGDSGSISILWVSPH